MAKKRRNLFKDILQSLIVVIVVVFAGYYAVSGAITTNNWLSYGTVCFTTPRENSGFVRVYDVGTGKDKWCHEQYNAVFPWFSFVAATAIPTALVIALVYYLRRS